MRTREINRFLRVIDEGREAAIAILSGQIEPRFASDRPKLQRLARKVLRWSDELEQYLDAEISKPNLRKISHAPKV